MLFELSKSIHKHNNFLSWKMSSFKKEKGIFFNVSSFVVYLLLVFLSKSKSQNTDIYLQSSGQKINLWQSHRPMDMAKITNLEVMCGNSYMEVQIKFDRPFNGIVFSKGAINQQNCIYVQPQSGYDHYKFKIMYDSCGSKPDLNGKFYENNVVIQFDKDLIEVWDEAKRLRCEWYNDYEKGVTKAPIKVSELDVIELNFRGDNIDCWMEIQQGKGPWASPVTGIVPLGSTLTMVVGIDDKQGEFDMRLKSCEASDSRNPPILLSDENGCVLRPKMISKFMKMKSSDSRATVVSYAFFHAFKFPDSMVVHVKCKVEICRYGCPEHCSLNNKTKKLSKRLSTQVLKERERKATIRQNFQDFTQAIDTGSIMKKSSSFSSFLENLKLPSFSYFFEAEKKHETYIKNLLSKEQKKFKIFEPQVKRPSAVPLQRTNTHGQPLVFPSAFNTARDSSIVPIETPFSHGQSEPFPYGPRSLKIDAIEGLKNFKPQIKRQNSNNLLHERSNRNKKRSITHSRIERSAELGVQSGYEVISEVDLAFEAEDVLEDAGKVTTFQGRIKNEERINGLCLTTENFSALFIFLSLLTVISVLVLGFVCYHRQIQKLAEESAPKPTLNRSSFRTIFRQDSEGAKPKRRHEIGIPPPAIF